MALEPWSNIDEKLGALAYIESVAKPECISILGDAMALAGLFKKAEDRNRSSLPSAGEISGAAAKALGRLEEIGGLQYLAKILFSNSASLPLRESAAYGLGGLTSKAAFDIYVESMKINDPVIHKRLVRSIQETFNRLANVNSPHAERLLVALFNRAITLEKTRAEDQEKHFLLNLIANHISVRGEEELRGVLGNIWRGSMWRAAVNILIMRGGIENSVALAGVLADYRCPKELYLKIGKKLEGSQDKEIKRLAKRALENYPRFLEIFGAVVPAVRRKREAQVEAAAMVLGRV